jgi:hypothetical protein
MREDEPVSGGARGFSGLQVAGIALFCVLASALLSVWAVRVYLYPSDFEPVALSAGEQSALDAKLARLEGVGGFGKSAPRQSAPGGNAAPNREDDDTWLRPEPYDESDADREIRFSERELNSLLAQNTDLATRVAIDLSDNLASARLLIPVDPDVPLLGGKTLRVNAGVGLAYTGSRPVVQLKGISVMGVPIPNAWLGNLKNVDLVEQYGSDAGFWRAFAAGVAQLAVEEGHLKIKLRE